MSIKYKIVYLPVAERDFSDIFRYKWDDKKPFFLLIGANHPTVRRYLGDPVGDKYPGIDSPLYHTILAEIIAEALAFLILEKQFKKEGQDGLLDYASTDTYYHRYFTEFLKIAHKYLVTDYN